MSDDIYLARFEYAKLTEQAAIPVIIVTANQDDYPRRYVARLWDMSVPTSTPRTGMSATCAMSSVNTGLAASGFITLLIVSIPVKRRPKPNILLPMFFMRSLFAIKNIRNPTKTIR